MSYEAALTLMAIQFNSDTQDSDTLFYNLIRDCKDKWKDEFNNNVFLDENARQHAYERWKYYERGLAILAYN